jgi:MFS family permease
LIKKLYQNNLKSKIKKKILLWLYLVYGSNFTTISALALTFPQDAIKKGLTEMQLGIIFSIETFVSAIVMCLLGKRMTSLGRNNVLLLGQFLQCIGCYLFSILIKINSKEMFMLLLFWLESFKDRA